MLYNTVAVITETYKCGGFIGKRDIYRVCKVAGFSFCRHDSYVKIGDFCYPS